MVQNFLYFRQANLYAPTWIEVLEKPQVLFESFQVTRSCKAQKWPILSRLIQLHCSCYSWHKSNKNPLHHNGRSLNLCIKGSKHVMVHGCRKEKWQITIFVSFLVVGNLLKEQNCLPQNLGWKTCEKVRWHFTCIDNH